MQREEVVLSDHVLSDCFRINAVATVVFAVVVGGGVG